DPTAAARITDRLARAGVSTTDRLILVHVSAGNPFRRWPQEAFSKLAAALAARDGTRVLLTSGPSEREAANRIAEAARSRLTSGLRDRVLTLGDFSLAELRALLDRVVLYIGGDSGPLHIAATSGVPIVGLYGPTLPVRSEPWRDPRLITESVEVTGLECRPCDQRTCTPGDFRCLTRISPEAVLEAVDRALGGGGDDFSLGGGDADKIGSDVASRLELTGTLALLGAAGALQFSIAAGQILIAVAIVCWAAMLLALHEPPSAPRFFWPLAIYAALTVFSAAFSPQPRTSLVDCKQLVLFLLVPVTYRLFGESRAQTMVSVIVSFAAASAAYGIFQYAILHYDNLGQRPQGSLGHYMTYSGLLMLVIGAALARVLFGRRERIWAALVMPALVVAVALTLTRNAWVGACAAAAMLLSLKDFRLLAVLPVVAALFFTIAGATVTARFTSVFSLTDPTNRDRVAMLREGRQMIRTHPLLGVGPNMVEVLYGDYRDPDAVQKVNPHLHNVPVQIAAERGLPALAAWLAFIVVLVADLARSFRAGNRFLAATALAAVVSMLAAGMFEYNFGDSEFLMLFL